MAAFMLVSPVVSAGIALSGLIPRDHHLLGLRLLPSHTSITGGILVSMDTPMTPPRSPSQIATSKTNGATSTGPVTPTGKAISSANGTTHGLASRGVLLPSERAQDYESNLNDWFETLVPRSRGEGQLVARVADVGWRMGRLSRLEERLVNSALERKLAESAPVKALQLAKDALQAVRSVAVLAEEVTTPRPSESVARIATGLTFVVTLLGKAEVPVVVVVAFEQAVTYLTAASYTDVEPEVFQTLGKAARHAEAALVEKIGELEEAITAERERLADSLLLGDDADAQVLDRHRSRLSRELGAHLSNLKLLRELAAPAREGERQEPIPVELRVVGRHEGL
jgi:hypothetical protein